MYSELCRLIPRFAGKRILVVGDAMLDSYFRGAAVRLSQEAPVPVAEGCQRDDFPGGAANVAANVRSLGGQPVLLSVVGADVGGTLLAEALARRGVSPDRLLVSPGRQTLTKQRVLCGSQMVVRFDCGTMTPLDEEAETLLLCRLAEEFFRADAVILSDYGYGVLTPRVIERLGQLQARSPRVIALDSKSPARYRNLGVTAVKPNYREVAALLNLADVPASQRADCIAAERDRLWEITGAHLIAVTLDCDGALLLCRDGAVHRIHVRPAPESRTSGAGDTFLAALSLTLACGGEPLLAGEAGAAAASVVVAKEFTACCQAQELMALIGPRRPVHAFDELAQAMDEHRRAGRRIVLTNGCFDILHRGHITYLSQAKQLGDVLVVGVNADESIRRLKGPARPINCLDDRLAVLAALSDVDHLAPFEEDTPHRLIETVRPDVFVKGGDYTLDTLPEASLVQQLGGKVVLLPFINGRSTTHLIERIRTVTIPPEAMGIRNLGDSDNEMHRLGRRQQRALRSA